MNSEKKGRPVTGYFTSSVGRSKPKQHTVFNPAPVIALIHRNSESVYETLRRGVEEPQNMTLHIKDVAIKYT